MCFDTPQAACRYGRALWQHISLATTMNNYPKVLSSTNGTYLLWTQARSLCCDAYSSLRFSLFKRVLAGVSGDGSAADSHSTCRCCKPCANCQADAYFYGHTEDTTYNYDMFPDDQHTYVHNCTSPNSHPRGLCTTWYTTPAHNTPARVNSVDARNDDPSQVRVSLATAAGSCCAWRGWAACHCLPRAAMAAY